ncbi:MAG TPA: FtsQ-type POTRA domain-containing protein [Micromonosporaceae bacterium]|nr:FtsQ-type POTRA domain-containing protein [Micromonosporaceae bacterium]
MDSGTRRWRLVRATATAIPPSVRRFNARARARRWRRARPLIVIAAVLVLVAGLGYAGYGTSLLGVAHVEVRGAGFVKATDIRTAAAVRPGEPFLGLDTGAVARRVEGLVGVAHADVSRRLPSTVIIDVRLRTPVAAVPVTASQPGAASHPAAVTKSPTATKTPTPTKTPTAPTSYRLVDASGVAFRTVGRVPPGVVVVDLTNPGPDDPATVGALAVLASLPPILRDKVDHVSARTPVEIQLMLTGGREIVWGDATDNATKARVASSLLGRSGTVIDVSAPNVVTVH